MADQYERLGQPYQQPIETACLLGTGPFIGCMSRRTWIHVVVVIFLICFLIGAIFTDSGTRIFFIIFTVITAVMEVILLYSRLLGHGQST